MKKFSSLALFPQDGRQGWLRSVLVTSVALSPFGVTSAFAQEQLEDCDRACRFATAAIERSAALIERFQLREAPSPARDRADWSPPRRIVTIYPGLTPFLRHVAPNAEIVTVPDTSEVAAVIAGADVYFGRCTPGMI